LGFERDLLNWEFKGLLENLLLLGLEIMDIIWFIGIINLVIMILCRFGRSRCEKVENVSAEQKDW
jgi:uncharacterized membrane protein